MVLTLACEDNPLIKLNSRVPALCVQIARSFQYCAFRILAHNSNLDVPGCQGLDSQFLNCCLRSMQASVSCQGQRHALAGRVCPGHPRGCPGGRATSQRAADRAKHGTAMAKYRFCRQSSAQKARMEHPRKAWGWWQRMAGLLARWQRSGRIAPARRPCLARE